MPNAKLPCFPCPECGDTETIAVEPGIQECRACLRSFEADNSLRYLLEECLYALEDRSEPADMEPEIVQDLRAVLDLPKPCGTCDECREGIRCRERC